MKSSFTARVRIISALIVACALLFAGQLYLVQIVRGESYNEKADRQYARPNYSLYSRGSIYFSGKDGGHVSAATLKSGFTVAINPKLIADPEAVYAALAKYLPLDKELFLTKASKKDDPYEEIAKKIEPEVGEKIDGLKIPGVKVYKERWRYYPGGKIAPQTIGFVAFKGDQLAGRYGLERYYDDVLKRDGDSAYANFFAEVFSNIDTTIFKNHSAEGDIVTTIEPTVQAFVGSEVKKTNEKWSSQQTGAIVMDPKTGEIFAMSVYPDFDANAFSQEENAAVFMNPLVESVFEMGSIIKPLTMAAGLDAGVVSPATTYDDKGFLILNGKRISNFDGKGRGVVSMQEVLNQSLNTGVAFVAQKLGNERMSDYFYSYGLGEHTGIDLPNEAIGLVDNLKSPRDIEHATASYGQGIAMSPIETVRALATLGNGGMLVKPHLVKRIDYTLGYSKEITPEKGKPVLKPETSEEITRMLVTVVDDALVGGAAKLDRFSVAAKTGTAQIANPDGTGYYADRYLHSFFGYFPAYTPRFIVFLYTLEPQAVRYASHTLTEPFSNITKFLLNYYEIPPDR